jgi:NAD(P)H dehydrogenase (quinone)
VYAHHEPGSFTTALKNVALQTLEQQGNSVVISDLYAQGFQAVAQKWDFVTTSGGHFNYMLEQKHAANLQMAFSPDIVGEIQKLKAADIVIFVTPIWWMGVPAILKGWFDRVLAMGVAWDNDKIYENGLMRGKQVLLVATGGQPADYYKSDGRHRATPNQLLYPINHTIFAYCGFNVHEPFVTLDILDTTNEVRDKVLKDFQFRAQNLIASPQWLVFYA